MIQFDYSDHGRTVMVTEDDKPVGVEGSRVIGVRTVPERHSGVAPRVLGLAVYNPAIEDWRAIAAIGEHFPPHPDARNPHWQDYPSHDGFTDKRAAALWLLGVADARSEWFAHAELAVRMARR